MLVCVHFAIKTFMHLFTNCGIMLFNVNFYKVSISEIVTERIEIQN